MLKKSIATLGVVLLLAGSAFAGAKTGDITVDSQVGNVTTTASGQKAKAEANVGSVDVKDGAKTGDITVKSKAGNVTTSAYGQGAEAKTNVGSVKVGGQ